jgi:hypothetical protein
MSTRRIREHPDLTTCGILDFLVYLLYVFGDSRIIFNESRAGASAELLIAITGDAGIIPINEAISKLPSYRVSGR